MTHPPLSDRRRTAALVVGLAGLLALVVTAFAWPASEVAPRHLPVAVAGPEPAVAAVADGLARLGEDAVDLQAVASRGDAVAAMENRDAVAAVVVTTAGPEVLTASAGGPAVASLMEDLAAGMSAANPEAGPVTVTDVVPLPADDPRGLALSAGSLALVLGGILTGVAVALRVRGRARAVATALTAAVAAGAAAVGVLQGWLGALDGSYWANTGVVALGVAAVAVTLVGLHRTVGLAGLALGAAVVLLLGNPLSGVTTSPHLLPDGWSTLGQLLPPGATGTALRSTAYFDGAGAAAPLLVLGGWVLTGAALAVLPRRAAARVTEPAAEAVPVG